MKKEKIMYRVVMGIIAFMFITMAYNTYLRFYPFKVLKINSVTIETPIVPVNGTFTYKVDYCKYLDIPATSYKVFYDVNNQENRYPLDATQGIGIVGCHVTNKNIQVQDIPPGEYYLKTTAIYQVNEYQTRQIDFITPNFYIK